MIVEYLIINYETIQIGNWNSRLWLLIIIDLT